MQVERESVSPDVDVPFKKERDECPASDVSLAPQLAPQNVGPGAGVRPELRSSPASAASLLANKYVLINPTEGCPLHKCIDVVNDREYVCRVSTNATILVF